VLELSRIERGQLDEFLYLRFLELLMLDRVALFLVVEGLLSEYASL
jgi:hypothetical protein